MKKLIALVLALALVLASCAVAFAASDGTLTVSNTTNTETYVLYKVFDATYSGTKVAYTYDGSNTTFLAALQAANELFTVTENLDGSYNIVKVNGATDADILDFIKDNASYYETIDTKTGNGSSIQFTGLDYGYYYVSSTVGSLVTIDSALKDVTVIDKNQTTDLDKEEKIANGTWVYDGDYSDSTTPPSAKIGETVNYKLEGQWTRYIGEDIVKTLKFHDVMSNGLTADQNVVVKFNGTTLRAQDDGANLKQYTVTYTLNNNGTADDTTDDYWVTDITIPVATITSGQAPVFLYNVTNTYEITYSAKIDKDALIDGEEQNEVTLKYDDENGDEKDIDDDKTKVKTYDVSLLKVDGKNTGDTADDSPLAGAKFELYAKDGTTPISVILMTGTNYGDGTITATNDNYYRLPEDGETTGLITELVVGTTGIIHVKGLANGQYEFEETEAPKGYNKMTARTSVATINNANAARITAINNSGTELPSTGGIGTTIFYILGGLLVVGAAVILVARRKASN